MAVLRHFRNLFVRKYQNLKINLQVFKTEKTMQKNCPKVIFWFDKYQQKPKLVMDCKMRKKKKIGLMTVLLRGYASINAGLDNKGNQIAILLEVDKTSMSSHRKQIYIIINWLEENYIKLRALGFVLVCFSLTNPDTLVI